MPKKILPQTAIPRARSLFQNFRDPIPDPFGRIGSWLEATTIEPVSAVEWQCSSRWKLEPRAVQDSMWFWIKSGHGRGRVGLEGAWFEIGPGDLILIPMGDEHTIVQAKGSTFKLHALHFHTRLFGGINLLDLAGFPVHVSGQALDQGTPIFEVASKRAAQEFALKLPGYKTAMELEIRRVLLYLIRNKGRYFQPQKAESAHALLPRLLPALEWLDRNLPDPTLKIGALADKIHVSEVQFRKLFKRATGLSPIQFIQRRRIERACALLRSTQSGLDWIAIECGFTDTPFFCRTFKKWVKVAPGEFRNDKGL